MDRGFIKNLTEKLKVKSEREILATERDGAYFAALSPDRINAAEWFPFRPEQSVLQAGAAEGAFTALAARTASWDIYDADRAALELAKTRYEANRNSGVAAEGQVSFRDTLPEKHYDILFLAEWPGRERAGELFGAVSPETVLILAENANALRFVTGAGKEADKHYASADELEQFAAAAGFLKPVRESSRNDRAESGSFRLYYPLPGLVQAKDIRSGKTLPGPGDFRGAAFSFTEDRLIACDEEALYDSLASYDPASIRQFAPCFLAVLMSRNPGSAEEVDIILPDRIRYNRSRRPETRIRTEIYTDSKVVKSALEPAADAHIRAFKTRYELLNRYSPEKLTVLPPEDGVSDGGRAAVTFPFVKGSSLGQRLASLIRNGEAPAQAMEEAFGLMLPDMCEAHNTDLLFDNVLETDDVPASGNPHTTPGVPEKCGKMVLIDYEWTSVQALDPRFVRYRAYRYFYEDHAQSLTAYRSLAQYLGTFGFSKEEQDRFERMEDEFQLQVHGSDKGSFENHFRKAPASVTQIRENARLYYADEVAELKAALAKERETERLSQQHIGNIEEMNRQKDAEIGALRAEVNYLQSHVSLFAKAKRKLVRKLDAWAPADSRKRLIIKYIKGTVLHPGVYIKRYLTKEGHSYIRGNFAIRGEFSEGGILELPETGGDRQPLVSVIIPAYNQVGYTYDCIRSVIAHTDAEKTPYEVILADDASSDATARITEWIRNLTVARTDGNLGFLRNCNNAARKARGEYLFFLNNDTKVTEGWLSSLLGLMEQDESIGMCGSRLVYPDGRLQEAGGIIWSDGSGWNYGRADDPEKCAYNYVKDVDYISGAAILIRTALWKEIGGFDERYAPAYCEDSDLAFEVRRHGKRVVYQPDSTVIHFEGISNGTDVNGSGLKRYQRLNQEKFLEKWAEELKQQSVNTGNPNPFAARERSQKKTTILVIDHYVPRWDRDAGSKTTFQYLQMFLKKGYNVKFLGDDFRREEPYTHCLEQMGIEVLYGPEMRYGIFRWLEQNKEFIGIAYLNRPHIASKYIGFLKDNTKIRCIFYGHDLHYLRIRREFELTGDIRKQRESETWRGLEYQVMEKADMTYYPSRDEIDEIHARRPELPARAITAYIYDKEDGEEPRNDIMSTEGLLFVGGFKHPPNADGVLWFAGEIWPAVHAALPEAHFYVAGSYPTPDILALDGKDNIEVLGFVSDERLKELYRTARLTVVPLRYGAGVKGKVVEALAENCVIVTTAVGAEGIPEAESAMAVVNAPDAFAERIIRLYGTPEEQERYRAACAPLIRKYYTTEAAWNVIAEDF